MEKEIEKRHNLPYNGIMDAEEFTEVCLDEFDYDRIDEVPRYEITGGMYVVPMHRPRADRGGVARVCVSRPNDLESDEVAEILADSGVFSGISTWVMDGKDVDEHWNERIYTVVLLEATEDEEEEEDDLTYW